MRIGVPGEFHEDRWQHSLANYYPTDLRPVSFRCHNRSSARRPCPQVLQSHLRVAKQSSIGPSARRPCPEVSQRHPRVAKGLSIGSSARPPRPEVSQSHSRVAKRSSIRSSARPPSTEPLLGQGHVARLSGTGVKPVSCRCLGRTSARRPCPQMPQWHPRVAKRSSIRHSARQTCPQVPQRHHPVAVSNRSFTCAYP